jgi:hypothetical protein
MIENSLKSKQVLASPKIKMKQFLNQDSKDYDNTFYNEYEDNGTSESSSTSDINS